MPKIFISYRRDDSAFVAQQIHEKLKERFGGKAVFIDVEDIPAGADFVQRLNEAIGQCDVLLAVIGDRWLDAMFVEGPKKGQRRLDDPDDLVRIEIATALKLDIPVIPVLVGKISMAYVAPRLPPDLEKLKTRNVTPVRPGSDLPHDLQSLVRGIKEVLRLPPLSPSDLALPPGTVVVPKGLRSFDEGDASFFIRLLPGPYREDGLPEAVHFWKKRIEETNPDKTFRVGVIYGPSGCGKSSIVKAGLLPHLGSNVMPVYVEATGDDTENRLLAALRMHRPYLTAESSLQAVQASREGIPAGQKVLIVLDQFEQFLHSTPDDEQESLVETLRECDGQRLQCVVMVRDDFLTPVNRFMKRLQIPLSESRNYALVDLFDKWHAKKVLALLGQAYGALPKLGNLTREQDTFLNRAISGLAEGDRVICVRLALFAEMVKTKEWTPATLKAVGGAEGVGVAFLEDSFVAPTAPPENRRHQSAAQKVLAALLPQSGTNIRGAMQTKHELLARSGYRRRPRDFEELLGILDNKLRLVTPTEGVASANCPQAADGKYYQLTHDYLVRSLRDWLTRKQKETRRGRAETRLAERSALWTAKPENQQLPLWWEDLSIRWFTDSKAWTEPQQRMMRRATRYFGLRTLLAVAVLASLLASGEAIRRGVARERSLSEAKTAAIHAETMVTSYLGADVAEVPKQLVQMKDYREWIDPLLARYWKTAVAGTAQKRNLAMAKLEYDPGQAEFLCDLMLTGDVTQFAVLRDFLKDYRDQLRDRLWKVLLGTQPDPQQQRLRAAGALAEYDPANPQWTDVASEVTSQLTAVTPGSINRWKEAMRPVADRLLPPLSKVFTDMQQGDLPRSFATLLLADYTKGDVRTLTNLLVEADAGAFAVLFPVLEQHGSKAVPELLTILDNAVRPTWNDSALDPSWEAAPPEVKELIESAGGMLTEHYAYCQQLVLSDYDRICDPMRKAGYRAVRFRPCSGDNTVTVAIVWDRCGQESVVLQRRNANDLLEEDQKLRSRGFFGADVAGYVDQVNGDAQDFYCGVWVCPDNAHNESWIYAGSGPDSDSHQRTDEGLRIGGFGERDTLQIFRDTAGDVRYSGVRRQGMKTSGWRYLMTTRQWARRRGEYLEIALRDLQCFPAKRIDYEKVLRRRLELDDDLATYFLLDTSTALERLTSQKQKRRDVWRSLVLAVLYSRQERLDDAEKELAVSREEAKENSNSNWIQIVAARMHKDTEMATNLLSKTENCPASDAYQVALECAWASSVFYDWQPELADSLCLRAIELLKRVYDDYQDGIETEPFLYPLMKYPAFADLRKENWDDCRFAAIWAQSTSHETQCVWGVSPSDASQQFRKLAADGFRPRVITVSVIGDDRRLQVASVWYRPLLSVDDRVSLAKRRANAAVALARLGREEFVWNAMLPGADVNVRSWVVKRAGTLGIDHTRLFQRLHDALSVGERAAECRAMILALGECDGIEHDIRSRYIEKLKTAFCDHPDPGVHSSTEWLLKQWGEQVWLTQTQCELAWRGMPTVGAADGSPTGGAPNWYVSAQGPTFAILLPTVAFPMGSPGSEPGREWNEMLHYQEIGRPFAIATTPITLEQFRRFRSGQGGENDDLKSPVVNVSWFAAAQYCNWLSQLEGLPESELVYVLKKTDTGEERWERAANHLALAGYRLPSEAEWEFACRAGATTPYCFGDSTDMLADYGYFAFHSSRAMPSGALKPNDFGLFDVHGNVWEWCDEMRLDYPTGVVTSPATRSSDRSIQVYADKSRTIRGGAFDAPPTELRSACRRGWTPVTALENLGFRVARTYRRPELAPCSVDSVVELLTKNNDPKAAADAFRNALREGKQRDIFHELVTRLESRSHFEQLIQELNLDPARTSLRERTLGDIRNQQAFQLIHVAEALELIKDPQLVRIAMIGVGVSQYLPVLGDRVRTSDREYALLHRRGLSEFSPDSGAAALIAAMVPNVEIIPASIRLEGTGDKGALLDAIEDAVHSKARIVVMGLSWPSPDVNQQKALERAYTQGVLLFTAAGNDDTADVRWPTACPGVLSVGAVTLTGDRTPYSNYGPLVDLAAPGGDANKEQITTLDSEGVLSEDCSGTSYSGGIAAGVAGLVLSANPDLTAEEVKKILQETAVKGDGSFAYGRVDAAAAVQRALALRTHAPK